MSSDKEKSRNHEDQQSEKLKHKDKNGSNGKHDSAEKSKNGKNGKDAGKSGENESTVRTEERIPGAINGPSRWHDADLEAESNRIEAASRDARKKSIGKSDFQLTHEDLELINSNRGLIELLRARNIRLKDVMSTLKYEKELVYLQIELVKLQRWVNDNGKRLAVVFEGRDAAGKGGAIRRFTEHLNPRSLRVVALPKPSNEERGQWYFQRYSKHLPNEGEIVFFDRSWYNRAVVEPVNKFCTESDYLRFMQQVPEWEHMLYEDGVTIIKFWFSISKEEQAKRFEMRRHNPLKQWKLSPIDGRAQELWNDYTHYKEEMLSKTHTSFSPWIIVKANNKKLARLESIRYVLDHVQYAGKEHAKVRITPDPNIVTRFHRNIIKID